MMRFRDWRNKQVGLADYGVKDHGAPKLKNKILPGGKTPDVPSYKWLNSPGSNPPSFAETRKRGLADYEVMKIRQKGLPRYEFLGGDSAANTRLDPGGDHRT